MSEEFILKSFRWRVYTMKEMAAILSLGVKGV